MKILHISDTHARHDQLQVNVDVDICIHSGDATNYRDLARNFHEFEAFVDWYANVPIPIKIYVAGNHDCTLYNQRKDAERRLRDAGIEYLNYDSLTIYDQLIYGYPTTPKFGDWYFMADRQKLQKHVDTVPENTTILINHGMPKGILDLTEKPDRSLEMAGDKCLYNKTQQLQHLKLFCGGHIHNNKNIINTGTRKVGNVLYSNGAMVKDAAFDRPEYHHHGNLIDISKL